MPDLKRYAEVHQGSAEGPILCIHDRHPGAVPSQDSSIPLDETLQAYRDYLAWVADGNTPDIEVREI